MKNINTQVYEVGISSTRSGSNYANLFEGIFTIRDNMTSRIIGSPVENGKTVFDNKVNNPDSVEIDGIIQFANKTSLNTQGRYNDSREVIKELTRIQKEREYTTYKIMTKYALLDNMTCERLSFSCVRDKYDAVEVSMAFKQLITAEVAYREYEGTNRQNTSGKTPANKDNSSTVSSGAKAMSSVAMIAANILT